MFHLLKFTIILIRFLFIVSATNKNDRNDRMTNPNNIFYEDLLMIEISKNFVALEIELKEICNLISNSHNDTNENILNRTSNMIKIQYLMLKRCFYSLAIKNKRNFLIDRVIYANEECIQEINVYLKEYEEFMTKVLFFENFINAQIMEIGSYFELSYQKEISINVYLNKIKEYTDSYIESIKEFLEFNKDF
ncbi:hypothetical protein H312_03369 [Anncaliia algerae PRA339]|uniref:Uncharacterized protein n=1 Tax=Anncaliia algerae PRA339 TaxID=1288291 RepID=A0A059EWZ4_9MICR|nr:hypothetical protein H312_03369 [Anncaliia algerae PRA339]